MVAGFNPPRHAPGAKPLTATMLETTRPTSGVAPKNREKIPAGAVPASSRNSRFPKNGLTKRQELWAQHFAEHGDDKAAAAAAGYSSRADNRGIENRRHPAILARVRELVQLRQSAGAPVAVGIIEQIAAGDFTDARKAAVQLKAATVMSHTAGVGPIVQTHATQQTTVEHIGLPSPDDVTAAIMNLRRVLGYPDEPAMIDITPAPGEPR